MANSVAGDLSDKPRFSLRKALLRSAAFGAGFAFVLCTLVGGWLWYSGKPKRPKPWNKQAITAEFNKVDTEGTEEQLAFLYTLQNNTADDFRLDSDVGVSITAKLKGQSEFAQFSQAVFSVDYPIFVPAKSRVRLTIRCKCSYRPGDLDAKGDRLWPRLHVEPTALEKGRDDSVLALYVADKWPNLDGFVLFDTLNRYEIGFQSGWEKRVAEIHSCVDRGVPQQACETDPGSISLSPSAPQTAN